MTKRLAGKTALITGSTSNIGRSVARLFAAEGAHVIVSGRAEARGEEVAADIRAAGGRADFIRADLDGTSRASTALAGAAFDALGGRIDVLVNNAGIYPANTTLTADEETFDRVYAVNVKAPFFLTRAVVPAMAENGGGAIVNLGSWVARMGLPVGALYSSTKGALETLTRSWSAEFAPLGIRVNAVSPGVIRPPDLAPDAEFAGESLMAGTPAGRAGHPDAIASAALYLASDEAEFIHGTVLDVDGGRMAVAATAIG
ncbi:SDR family NAD(P)-dependent oxidoreductase [Streptomyces sp. 796.1]|uniref:SDR family NAD(P)-dependent oxidoreductase n=1 Tax=Streptomyces sp. 796.1 TaxID=3163029 RepID=UPI0039C9762A